MWLTAPEMANQRYAVAAAGWTLIGGGVDIGAQRETPAALFQIVVGTN